MKNVLSLLIGGLIAVMILFNGMLAAFLGNYSSTVIIHIVGLVSISILLVLTRSTFNFKQSIPWHLYSAGAIGVFTVLCNNLSFLTLGASLTLSLGLLGQSITSLIIDHFGLWGMPQIPLQKKKGIGFAFILLGIFIMSIY